MRNKFYKTKYTNILTKKLLIKEYLNNKKSATKIAKEINCGISTVNRYLKRNKIKIRTKSELMAGKNNPFYIDGRKTAKYFCIKCGAKITYEAWFNGFKRCQSCANKGKNNPNYGNHFSEEIKQKIRDSKYHKNLKIENNPNYKDGRCLKKYHCKDCGKEISLGSALYGSGRCQLCYHKNFSITGLISGENHYNWQGGVSFEPYPLGWNKTFKEQIRYRDNYKCQLCGCPEVECNRKLHVHHIDYDKNNLKLENLISLCQSCHMKTNYNREYWQEYFEKEIICSIN